MFYYKSFLSVDLGFIKIQAWGFMVAIAFLVALWLAIREAERRKLNKDHVYGIVTIALIGGILGSRLANVLGNWNYYAANPLDILKIWEGGLSFFGGFITVLVLIFFYLKKKKARILSYLDALVPSVAIGHAIGRTGCIFGDGGHLGKITTKPWGAMILNKEGEFYSQARHLTSLYEMIELSLIFIVLYLLRKKRYFEGFLFSIYAVMYSFARFFTDFYRIDPTYFGLTPAQWISIALFGIFGTFIIVNRKKIKL